MSVYINNYVIGIAFYLSAVKKKLVKIQCAIVLLNSNPEFEFKYTSHEDSLFSLLKMFTL